MPSRRSRSGQPPSNISRWITEQQQISDHLLALLPQSAAVIAAGSDKTESAAKVLQEICDYIRDLHREVDGLSERLSELLVVLNDAGRHQPP